MAKDFSKSMSFEAFKTMQKETTPLGIFNEFVDIASKVEKVTNDFNKISNTLTKEFLKKNDRFLFVYEHLPNADDSNMSISERANLMKTAEHWTISTVKGKNEIIISFMNGDKYTSTLPITFNEFKEFLGV